MKISVDDFRNMDTGEQGHYLAKVLEEELGVEIIFDGMENRDDFCFTSPQMEEAVSGAEDLYRMEWPIYFDEDEEILVLQPYRGMPEDFYLMESATRARTVNEMDEEEEEDGPVKDENGEEWKVKFKIGDVWEEAEKLDTDDPDEFDQFKGLIMPKIRNFHEKMEVFMENTPEVVEDLANLIKELTDSEDALEWDHAWEKFYQWADENEVLVEVDEAPDTDENNNGIDDALEDELFGI